MSKFLHWVMGIVMTITMLFIIYIGILVNRGY